jgi:hypothetical protein
MFDSCSECGDLWREFGEAASRHIVAENKLKRALLEGDHTTVHVLQWQTTVAFEQKAKLRDAIRKHDTESHGEIPRAF